MFCVIQILCFFLLVCLFITFSEEYKPVWLVRNNAPKKSVRKNSKNKTTKKIKNDFEPLETKRIRFWNLIEMHEFRWLFVLDFCCCIVVAIEQQFSLSSTFSFVAYCYTKSLIVFFSLCYQSSHYWKVFVFSLFCFSCL